MGADGTRPAAVQAAVLRRLDVIGIPSEAVAFELTDGIAMVIPEECAPTALDCQDIQIIGEGTMVKDAIYDKVGATTGWTYGAARGTRTCVKYGNFECVTWVAAGAWDGDSGAPVLRFYSNNTALLVGMAFAKADGGFWMNPMSQIRKHFDATGSNASQLRTY